MKRLWVRLSAVAAVVASLGGGGYYLMSSGTAASEEEGQQAAVGEEGEGGEQSQITPLTAEDGQFSPQFDASPAPLDEGGYAAPEPAQANWRDQPSQPIIRQVSGNETVTDVAGDGGYGSDSQYSDRPQYGVGDAPPADPSTGYGAGAIADGGAAYDPNASYGAADSEAGYGSIGDGGGDSAYPTTAGGYGSPGNAADNSPASFGANAPVAPPSVTPRDVNQPVTAPSFATGEPIGPAPGTDLGPPPETAAPPVVAAASPQFDSSPPPQFDQPVTPTTPPAAEAYLPPAQPAPTQRVPTQPAPTQPIAYNQPPAVAAIAAGGAALVAATPGERTLEGRQTPSVSMEKIAPVEIQVGKPASFKTVIRNTGQVTARNVAVTDRVPQGTQLVDVTPQPAQTVDGSLVWQFEALEPGEEVVISMEVMPQVEGEIGTQALVTFQAQATVRTICTKPQLLVEHSTDPKVLIGQDVVFDITISNPGSGDATSIVLEEDVPPGLSHVAGKELEYEVGTLRPGESRRLQLVLKASEAGVTSNKLRVRADANLLAEHATQLEVIAPKLLVGMIGPQRRYLDRQVKYQVAFGNGGTAIAKNVELATYLPKGLKFVSTGGQGQYDARDHAVYWSLDQLAPGQEGTVELTALPVATGEQKLQIEGTADLGLSHKSEHTTVVEAITELVFNVSDTQDPIEVGSETTYEIHIVNNGSKTATNVQMAAILPAELTPLSGEGTTRVAVQGQQVVMEPLERLGPRDEAVYKIRVKGQRAGDHLIDVRLVSDEVPTPVTKQESTKVYADGL